MTKFKDNLITAEMLSDFAEAWDIDTQEELEAFNEWLVLLVMEPNVPVEMMN